MSLFEDPNYQYHETYFLLFKKDDCPEVDALCATLGELGPKYETVDVKTSDGAFEALTVRSPYDFSAMDIIYSEGEDVTTQVDELMDELRTTTLTGDDHQKMLKLDGVNARFEIFHFEQIAGKKNDDESLDPGGLLLVLDKLADLCNGVGVDPASNTLM